MELRRDYTEEMEGKRYNTDEVADEECLVAGPEGVVDVGVPPDGDDVVRRAGEAHRATGHHGDGQQQPERHCHGSEWLLR
jgi:hypothetical protein